MKRFISHQQDITAFTMRCFYYALKLTAIKSEIFWPFLTGCNIVAGIFLQEALILDFACHLAFSAICIIGSKFARTSSFVYISVIRLAVPTPLYLSTASSCMHLSSLLHSLTKEYFLTCRASKKLVTAIRTFHFSIAERGTNQCTIADVVGIGANCLIQKTLQPCRMVKY